MVDITDLCVKALMLWGADAQITQCIEELSELKVKLLHWRRNKTNKKEVLEEIADAEIMLKQMKLMFDENEEYEEIFLQKSRKLKSHIKNQGENNAD